MDFRFGKYLDLRKGKLIPLFFLVLALAFLFYQGAGLRQKQLSRKYADDYNREFEKAVFWLKDNSRPDDIVLSEWTLGHQIAAIAGRRVVATTKVYPSEAASTAERYRDIANFFLADSESEALKIAKKYEAELIFAKKDFSWSWTCSHIVKCGYTTGTIADRIRRGDKFSSFLKVYQSPNFLIFRIEENLPRKIFAGFPEDFYSNFFDPREETFFPGIGGNSPVFGAILPHHISYTGRLLADFFKNLAASRQVDTFILLGPDHYNKAEASVVTANLSWETPWGEVEPDLEIINVLGARKLAALDNFINEKEHALKDMIPFIRYYFPRAKVVPLIFKNKVSDDRISTLAEELAAAGRRIFIIVSVDFSHRLSLADTLNEDERSSVIINNLDSEGLKSANVEAKPAISVLFSAMKKLGAVKADILKYSNNLELLKDGLAVSGENPPSYLVSYFWAVFGR